MNIHIILYYDITCNIIVIFLLLKAYLFYMIKSHYWLSMHLSKKEKADRHSESKFGKAVTIHKLKEKLRLYTKRIAATKDETPDHLLYDRVFCSMYLFTQRNAASHTLGRWHIKQATSDVTLAQHSRASNQN